MARKALKLEVTWPGGTPRLLPVDYDDQDVISVIRNSGSRYVRWTRNDVIVKNFFGENNKVSDVSRYGIVEGSCVRHNDRYHICNNRYLIPHCDISRQQLQDLLQEQQLRREQQQIGNIVLLLESPHKDEYQPGNINCPIAPANGDTGHKIDRFLGTVLSRIKEQEGQQLIVPGRHVIISNPIQFQTSLHAIHGKPLEGTWKKLGNKIWWTLWNEQHIQQCFRERLVDTYNPRLIINACTGNFTPTGRQRRNQDLRRNVTKFIREHLPIVPLYEAKHPGRNNWTDCDWASCRWRAVTNCNSYRLQPNSGSICLQSIP